VQDNRVQSDRAKRNALWIESHTDGFTLKRLKESGYNRSALGRHLLLPHRSQNHAGSGPFLAGSKRLILLHSWPQPQHTGRRSTPNGFDSTGELFIFDIVGDLLRDFCVIFLPFIVFVWVLTGGVICEHGPFPTPRAIIRAFIQLFVH